MLVPSTFTGWYRKMMMNADMAREMIRSRSHTPIPVPMRTGATTTAVATSRAGTVVHSTAPAPGIVSGIPVYCIQNLHEEKWVVCRRRQRRILGGFVQFVLVRL